MTNFPTNVKLLALLTEVNWPPDDKYFIRHILCALFEIRFVIAYRNMEYSIDELGQRYIENMWDEITIGYRNEFGDFEYEIDIDIEY